MAEQNNEDPKIVVEDKTSSSVPSSSSSGSNNNLIITTTTSSSNNNQQTTEEEEKEHFEKKLLAGYVALEVERLKRSEHRVEANNIVHSLEDQGTMMDFYNKTESFYHSQCSDENVAKYNNYMTILAYERIFSIAREAYYELLTISKKKTGRRDEFLPGIDEDFNEVTEAAGEPFTFEYLNKCKIINQIRNKMVRDRDFEKKYSNKLHEIKELINNIEIEEFTTSDQQGAALNEFILQQCIDRINQQFQLDLKVINFKFLLSRVTGLSNFGQLLHIVNSSEFKIRTTRDIEGKKDSIERFLKCLPRVLEKCFKLLSMWYGNTDDIPDISTMIKRIPRTADEYFELKLENEGITLNNDQYDENNRELIKLTDQDSEDELNDTFDKLNLDKSDDITEETKKEDTPTEEKKTE